MQEVLSFIEERMSELEQEKSELTEYEGLDRQRRSLEHCLYERELSAYSEQLNGLENSRRKERDTQEQLHSEVQLVQV